MSEDNKLSESILHHGERCPKCGSEETYSDSGPDCYDTHTIKLHKECHDCDAEWDTFFEFDGIIDHEGIWHKRDTIPDSGLPTCLEATREKLAALHRESCDGKCDIEDVFTVTHDACEQLATAQGATERPKGNPCAGCYHDRDEDIVSACCVTCGRFRERAVATT